VTGVDLGAAFPALGTTAVVLVDDPDLLDPARAAVELVIHDVDRACSRFRPDSELVALNARSGRAVAVSPLLFEAVGQALRAARVTNGLVDPTLGRELQEIGYDRNFAEVPPDGPPLVVTLHRRPGWASVQLGAALDTITVPSGVELDLGATAKALCADRAARAAFDAVGCGVLVGLGGDLAVAGPAPDGGWPVRVTDDHAAGPDAPGQDVSLAVGGLATSSVTVRHWTRGDDALHHLLDPATGRPATVVWRTVSVAAASCLDANIATTASMLLGEAAPEWLRERHLPARLVRSDGRVVTVAGWPADDEAGAS